MLGTLCSFPVTKWINPAVFRNVLKVVIAAAALACIYRAMQ